MPSSDNLLNTPAGDPNVWALAPDIAFLNHGAFGACPRPVLDVQRQYRDELEMSPVQFMTRRRPQLLDDSRQELARFLGASADDIVFVPNATTGVNAVLGSLALEPGDELLTTDHVYNACQNAMCSVTAKTGARVVVARVPFPVRSSDQVVEHVTAKLSDRTRLVLLDHITSPTALVFPLEKLIAAIHDHGIDILVDGAHAPGVLPLDLNDLGVAFYAGNCHKWMCCPKGSGFLHVRPDRQHHLQPPVVSHGWNTRRPGRSQMQELFDWTGTADPTPCLCIPAAIRFLDTLMPGGWKSLTDRNCRLTLAARSTLCHALDVPAPAPDEMISVMATIPLREDAEPAHLDRETAPSPTTALQNLLFERARCEVPVYHWPEPPFQCIRISAQAYNTLDQYESLANTLRELI